jgi:hypothetical protein
MSKAIDLARLVLFLCVVGATSGCVLVPFVQAFKESGLTESDRMALLPPRLKKFSDARMFGNKTDALDVVMPESQNQIAKQLSEVGEHERVVKSKVEEVEWSDSAHKAKVMVKVESYKVTQLIVTSVTEEQQWEYSTSSGWLLKSRSKVEG